jgi:hypothetical protein
MRALHEAVYAINRALNLVRPGTESYEALIRARDEVWAVGVRLYPTEFVD